jgi:hypothetical protein
VEVALGALEAATVTLTVVFRRPGRLRLAGFRWAILDQIQAEAPLTYPPSGPLIVSAFFRFFAIFAFFLILPFFPVFCDFFRFLSLFFSILFFLILMEEVDVADGKQLGRILRWMQAGAHRSPLSPLPLPPQLQFQVRCFPLFFRLFRYFSRWWNIPRLYPISPCVSPFSPPPCFSAKSPVFSSSLMLTPILPFPPKSTCPTPISSPIPAHPAFSCNRAGTSPHGPCFRHGSILPVVQ